jgi:alpha-amylase/alpha-mannosidase (GH57 family)
MTFAPHSDLNHTLEKGSDQTVTATGVYVTVHGHFYQPPRENPYIDRIERQSSATPFHDWNERIHYECYRNNAFSRIVNERSQVVAIINNFEYLSFNIGATLMSWLEKYDLEVYGRIIEADRRSCARLNEHGNAIAQVYNHIILPLANEKDKYTQVRWGKEDFRHRFGRDPEGMWLAETAVDYPTLKVLIEENIRFIVLAPSQAAKCRPLGSDKDPEPKWQEVGGSQIDPTRPYRCFIEDGRYIDIFFYDGPISRDMGFSDLLSHSHYLVTRLAQAVRGDNRPSQIISVATDGETFGHHKHGTEKCLAYAFTNEFPKRGWTVTNFAHYLSLHSPTWEVKLKPVTAWSCAHGVDRWQDNCGCGGDSKWHQKWRRPLRDSLDWLRDRLIDVYLQIGKKYFRDPWLARDKYIEVILDRSRDRVEEFFTQYQTHPLDETEKIDALRLLEMQRHALLMYTSCGWFFEELSRPEGVQILRYAARALELAGDVAGVNLEQEFIKKLKTAPSNVEEFGDGAEVYRQLVIPSQIGFKQLAAHYAIGSLFENYNQEHRIYCYNVRQLDYQKEQIGTLTVAVGEISLHSEITWENHHFIFAVAHIGGWDFHCCIQPFTGRLEYTRLKHKLFENLKQASGAQIVLTMTLLLGDEYYNLQHIFPEERHRIMNQLTENTKERLDRLYDQVYRDNYGVLVAFHRDELPVPQELQVAAEISISHRCLKSIAALEKDIEEPTQIDIHLAQLKAIATEAELIHCQLNVPEGKKSLERLIWQRLWQVLYNNHVDQLENNVQRISRIVEIGDRLHLNLCLDRIQELYYQYLEELMIPQCLTQTNDSHLCRWDSWQIRWLLKLGKTLKIDVSKWLEI